MVNSFEELRDRRLSWVDANRANKFEAGIKRLLTDLYPDNAHFIFELMQNAEDAKATVVRFTLTESELEFEHNGKKLFDLHDVESITSIGESTKIDDETSVGKFGVGFKAVFAYTTAPEIYSGVFCFRIRDLVVPERIKNDRVIGDDVTLISLPFNHPEKTTKLAINEVSRGLQDLGDTSLLFLNNIRVIEYMLPDGAIGKIERLNHENRRTEIKNHRPNQGDSVSYWLHFQNNVEIIDEDNSSKPYAVAIAYRLSRQEVQQRAKKETKWAIEEVDKGEVCIYFPAAKETSNLKFHVHAPFASTVARDSVRDCSENEQLRDAVAQLVVESLGEIRDMGLLTVPFLAALPNLSDSLSAFYEPIREAIVNAFWEEPLMPTRSRAHAPASVLYQGPAKIARLITDDILSGLTGFATPLWAANAPQQNQRDARFIESLGMEVFGWVELIESLSAPYVYDPDDTDYLEHKAYVEELVASQNDEWLMRFYALLEEGWEEEEEVISGWEDYRVVRVATTTDQQRHVKPESAFFPSEEEAESPPDIFFVDHGVYAQGDATATKRLAKEFLTYLGVRHYDESAAIERRLQSYLDRPCELSEAYFDDLQSFVRFWKKHPESISMFREHSFLCSEDTDEWCSWRLLCLDVPYEKTGLDSYYSIHQKKAVWSGYRHVLAKEVLEDFVEFLKSLGVMWKFQIKTASTFDNPEKQDLQEDWITSDARRSSTGIDEDYTVDNLLDYLRLQDVEISRLIWDAVINAEKRMAFARFRPNRNYPTREGSSILVYWLRQEPWVATKGGGFKLPRDVSHDDLLPGFVYDDSNRMLTAIGFGMSQRARQKEYQEQERVVKTLGFESLEVAQLIGQAFQEREISVSDLKAFMVQRQVSDCLDDTVPDPERRREKVLEEAGGTPIRSSDIRLRSVRTGNESRSEAKQYLRAKYKGENGNVVCQCCRKEMPFKVNGECYFEAIECIPKLEKHFTSNRLALCPTCAAMYQHARQTDDQEIKNQIALTSDEVDTTFVVTVRLADENYELFFTTSHWFDLTTVLEEYSR